MSGGLSDLEQKIVDYLEGGYARWKIAELMEIGETTVREHIRKLCLRYDCSSRDLPQVVRKETHANSEDR